MTIDRTNEIVALALALIALLGAFLGWIRWIRPRWRRLRGRAVGALDALVGRDAVHDSITGREIAPALPGIGTRMETVERAVAHIAELLDSQQTQDKRIDDLERRVEGLESAAIERVAGKAESISAFRAIEAVAKQYDPSTPEIPQEES